MGDTTPSDINLQDGAENTFFLHQIDPGSGSVRVQILNCSVSQTFLHHTDSKGSQKKSLENKTSGFLTAVSASEKPVVLAWAESGHGLGIRGDKLQASAHILRNAKWAYAAIKMAKILELDLTSVFDDKAGVQGGFQASHVEVKLATHATILLLYKSGQLKKQGEERKITQEALRKLQQLRWTDGSPLRFQIHVSRKNCSRCGAFLKRLAWFTGIRFELRCGKRLVPIEYQQQALLDAADLGLAPKSREANAIPELQTYEQDGVTHYISPETEVPGACGNAQKVPRVPKAIRISPHHLSDVDKPLPATPVIEAPDWNSFYHREISEQTEASVEASVELPFPQRSPRPY